MAKQRDLVEIETKIQHNWLINKQYEADPEQGEKYFVTFPYPYMNGRLHIGHAFTVLKADFMARYQRLQGKNVLFPFGFHCTGMPIQAAAIKLHQELTFPLESTNNYSKKSKLFNKQGQLSQKDILLMNLVPEDDIHLFTNTDKWIEYFLKLGKIDLQKLGLSVDWRRSFTTVNKHYDSFIKWQFNILLQKNKLIKGIRPTICTPDLEPCGSHDRRTGEDVNLEEKVMCLYETENLNTYTTYLTRSSEDTPIAVKYNENIIIISQTDYDLIKWQHKLEIIDHDVNIFIKNTNHKELEYYACEEVISRTGYKCIVANVEQWYITYGSDKEWLKIIEDYVCNTLNTYSAKNTFETTITWLQEWACTRSKGLGTKFDNYIIESLSDSTIYPSYYTISHLIKDIDPDKLTPDVYDYIFGLSDIIPISGDYTNLRNSFKYWYPLDLRVSGKDLIQK